MAITAATKKLIESQLYADIKQDLLDQLDRNNTTGKYYCGLVGDYMDLWVMKSLLVQDIQTRGINVKYNNGGGQSGVKKNESVEQRLKVNAQMLKLLAELGISPSQSGGGGDDEMYFVLARHNWRKIKPRSKHPKKASPEVIEASKKLTQESKK